MTPTSHLGELALRRLLAGELEGPDGAEPRAHAESCPDCQSKLRGLEDEQRRFEREVPFERFAAGVERAARHPKPSPLPSRAPRWGAALAAAFALTVGASVLLRQEGTSRSVNRVKGAADVELVVNGQGGVQRKASRDPKAPEPLSPGEQLRLGVAPEGHRYLVVVSVDEAGVVTPLYPEGGEAMPAAKGYLPGSFELTGAGIERLVVVMTDEPIRVDEVVSAARRSYERAGQSVESMGELEVVGEQFHRTFLKP